MRQGSVENPTILPSDFWSKCSSVTQERVENKAHRHQIKKLQGDLLTVDNEVDKGESTHKMLNEK